LSMIFSENRCTLFRIMLVMHFGEAPALTKALPCG
jgi:hypothetical protein